MRRSSSEESLEPGLEDRHGTCIDHEIGKQVVNAHAAESRVQHIVGNIKANRLYKMAAMAPGSARGREGRIEAEESGETAGTPTKNSSVDYS